MKRLLVFLFVFLLAAPCHAVKQSNEIADITYLLRCFSGTTADQSYVNAQVIDTPAEGCLDGSLTVIDTDTGTVSSSLNTLRVTGSTSWLTTSLYSQALTKNLGLTLFNTWMKDETNTTGPTIGLSRSIGAGNPNAHSEHQVNPTTTARRYVESNFTTEYLQLANYASSTLYYYAIVLGGSNSSGVPYKIGDTKADYLYGASVYEKIGGTWTFLVRTASSVVSPLYFMVSEYNGNANLSNILIPNYDFSAVLQPTHLSTFTAADATALADYTPDVGGAWTSSDGVFVINSNKLSMDNVDGAHLPISLSPNCAVPNYITLTGMYSTGVANFSQLGAYVRVDPAGYPAFWLYSSYANNWIAIYERTAYNTYTSRATTVVAIPADTNILHTIIDNGSSVSIYVGSSVATYSSSLYNTNTRCGPSVYTNAPYGYITVDNFAVWPLTSTTYTSEFAKVGY